MGPRLNSLICFLLFFPGLLLAGDAWKEKPSAEWTQEESLTILTDSPWSRRVTVWQLTGQHEYEQIRSQTRVYSDAPGEPPVVVGTETAAATPQVVEGLYGVQWSSAASVQQAWKRLTQLDVEALAELHALPPEVSSNHFVVTVRVLKPPPTPTPDLFVGLDDAELVLRARLRTSRKLSLEPERILRYGRQAGSAVAFFFPRAAVGAAELDWFEFRFKGALGDELKARFKVKEMQRSGQPDY